MTEAEIRELSRGELRKRLMDLTRKYDSVKEQLADAHQQLKEREINRGNIEEPDTMARCAAIEEETRLRCTNMVEQAQKESQEYWDQVYNRIIQYSKATESLRDLIIDFRPENNGQSQ